MSTDTMIHEKNLHTTTMRSAGQLIKRSLINTRRLPSAFIPTLAMPIFNMVSFSGTFFALTKLPGFPTDRSVNWFMPLGLAMGAAFSGVGLGFSLIRDLENGFYDRLRMSPTSRISLIVGPVLATWIRVTLVAIFVFIVGGFLGARPTAGATAWAASTAPTAYSSLHLGPGACSGRGAGMQSAGAQISGPTNFLFPPLLSNHVARGRAWTPTKSGVKGLSLRWPRQRAALAPGCRRT